MTNNIPVLTFRLLAGYKDSDGTIHDEVVIREMTGADEEAIAKAEVRNNIGKIVTTLLSSCIQRIGTIEKSNIKAAKWEEIINELFLGDRDLILMKIRELTYGNEMSFQTQCRDCRKSLTIDFTMDELEVRPLKDDPHAISFTLPRGYFDGKETHTSGTMRLPTGFDQEQLDSVARKNPGLANTTLITRCVTELGSVKLSSKVFREMGQKDRDYLVSHLADKVFGPRFIVNTVCDHCGHEFEAGVNPLNFIL